MRTIFLALAMCVALPGCGDDCTEFTACSPDTDAHYKFCNAGKADDCYYVTGDGQKLHCVSCGDCTNAQQTVTDWCSEQPDRGAVGGRSSSGGTLGTSCSNALCPNGGTYQFCTSPTTATNCGFKTSDGEIFACNTCTDCGAATTSVSNWCVNGAAGGNTDSTGNAGGSTGSDSACRSSSDCQTCCADLHAAGGQAYANLYSACTCPLCSVQCGEVPQCATNSADCIQCLSNAAQSTCLQALLTGCGNNADCNAYMQCTMQCN